MTTIDDAQFQPVANYVRRLADRMGLRDWELAVEITHEGDPGIEVVPGRKCAAIQMPIDAIGAEDAEFRYFVVHELVHCHLNPILTVGESIRPSLGLIAYEPFSHSLVGRLEDGVDGIARAWALALPLRSIAEKCL